MWMENKRQSYAINKQHYMKSKIYFQHRISIISYRYPCIFSRRLLQNKANGSHVGIWQLTPKWWKGFKIHNTQVFNFMCTLPEVWNLQKFCTIIISQVNYSNLEKDIPHLKGNRNNINYNSYVFVIQFSLRILLQQKVDFLG